MAQPYDNPLPGRPLVESPFFEAALPGMGLDAEETRIARELHEQGFAVLDFPAEDFDTIAGRLKADLAKTPELADMARIGPDSPVPASNRLANHTSNADVREIAGNARILEILSKIYGRRAFPFQTLNFGMGTQQHYHSDSVHFSSIPERFMVGVWVALEDIGPDQGPLIYYPGSHKWPILQSDDVGHSQSHGAGNGQAVFDRAWEALVAAENLQPVEFHPRKGQALIWAANLLHGGAPHKDQTQSRWSQVTHYFFEDCAYYTPLFSNPRLGDVYFRGDVKDVSTGEAMPNKYMGRLLSEERTNTRRRNTSPVELARRALNRARHMLAARRG